MQESMNREQTESKFIGVSIPLALHKRLRVTAAKDELSLSGLLREALIERLERDQDKND